MSRLLTPEEEGRMFVIKVISEAAKEAGTEQVRQIVLESILESLGFKDYKVRRRFFKKGFLKKSS